MNCQEIFVFENGKIAESGKFSDLQRYKDVEIQENNQEEQLSPTKEILVKKKTSKATKKILNQNIDNTNSN